MNRSIDAEILELRRLPVRELGERYLELWGKAPRCRNRAYLWRRCAYKLLERENGGMAAKARDCLDSLIAEIELPQPAGQERTTSARVAAGTVLTRMWRGREVVAVVRDDGTVECDGEIYTSLSAAASGVTGTKWNGRLFFGLTKRAKVR